MNELSLDKMNEIAREYTDGYNNTPLEDFERFTPSEMTGLIYFPFDPSRSCMRMNEDVDEEKLKGSYFVKDIRLYLERIRSLQPMKLTVKGNLQRKFCRDLISDGTCSEGSGNFDKWPLMREDDSHYILVMDNFTRMIGLTKKRNNRLSLTRKGEKMVNASLREFYLFIIEEYCKKLNWGCVDFYPDAEIVQKSFPFSLFLIQKYGNEKRKPLFYSGKIIKAFPRSLDEFDERLETRERSLLSCYSLRVFKRFMKRFDLIEIMEKKSDGHSFMEDHFILKRELVDDLILWDRNG